METINNRLFRVDATALGKSQCLRRLYLSVVEGWRSKIHSVEIEYGSAFHVFVEEYFKSKYNLVDSLAAAQEYFRVTPHIVKDRKDYLNINHLTLTCMQFHEEFTNNPTSDLSKLHPVCIKEVPLIEKTFSIPYFIKQPGLLGTYSIALTGTIDMIAQLESGLYVINDYKTTALKDQALYFRQYKLSGQLALYLYAIQYYAKQFPNSIYADMCKKRVAVAITGAFLDPKLPTQFKREIYFYTYRDMAEYKCMLEDKLQALSTHIADNILPFREGFLNGACQEKYSECMFYCGCSAPEGAMRDILRNNYVQVPYNPLKFRKKK
jgi:hypothetical protein